MSRPETDQTSITREQPQPPDHDHHSSRATTGRSATWEADSAGDRGEHVGGQGGGACYRLLRPQAPYTGTLVAAQGGSSGFDMVGGTSFSTMPVDTSSTRQTPKIRELSCGGSLFLRRSQVPWPPFQTDYESGYLSPWRRNRLTLVISTVCARLRSLLFFSIT